ncbi:hypothetical protein GCM10010466_01470 [Planomonospora alba]|uniref:histidine kinase n=1 Tax=Planomonospora alba TaxID=161354 RepID=A0ABP6MHG5_9ACTN
MSATDRIRDARRLRTLHATGLLEAAEVPRLDRVTRLAVRWLGVSAAMVSLVDAERQIVVSAAGSAAPGRDRRIPLSQSLCRHIVANDAPLTVPDVRADTRWREVGAARVGPLGSYAGMPLRAGRGQVLGTLCVVDAEPRQWSGEQLETLEDLAALAEAEIEARLARTGPRRPEDESRFLRALLDSLDVGVDACDAEGQVIFTNLPLREIRTWGPHAHALDAGDAFQVFAADGRTPLRGDRVPLARVLAGERIDGEEVVARPPGVEPRRFAVTGRPIEADDGRTLGAVVTLHDITAARRAETLRSAQHAVVEVLADAASTQEAAVGVAAAVTEALGWTYGEYWQVDPGGESITSIAFWSRPGRDLTAFTAGQPTSFARGQDLPGLAWERGEPVWIGDMAAEPRDFSRLQGALRAGLRSAMALPVRSGDQVLGVLIFGADHPQQPDRDLVDLLDGVCAHIGRYMERRRAEELSVALAESRRQFDQIVNQLTDKIWTVEIRPDGTARPIYVNTEHTTVFGGRLRLGPDDDFIAVMLRLVHPDDHDAFHAYCAELVSGRRAQLEYRLIGLDGVTRWIWTRGVPRREGERLLVDGISTDVTGHHEIAEERERLLAQRQQQVDRLRELDAMKDDLMAMASHELRSPISVIRSYAEMLREAPELPEDYRTFIEVIDRKSDHLQHLVDDLLDLARLESGRVSIDARTVWLTRLVRQAVDEHRAAARARRIDLTADLPHHLHVHADPVRLRQVMDNLLSNAVKYTPDGGTVTVTGEHRRGGDGRGGTVAVTVADSGIGIPADQYDQLFTRFFRASTARRAGIKGTGLGLAVTKAIVEAHGGTVTAAPREGGGTAFTVCLPADPSAPG